jgi:tRNA dimethylallyltransferase
MPKIHIICGPTASGKSAHALQLAKQANGVIINADSQQVYAELRILTARPAPEDEARAPHRLYGFLPAAEPCSAGLWLTHAKMEIDWALSQNQTPIVVGGTGLYLKALIEGISEMPDIAPAIRAQAQADLSAMGAEAFHARLAEVDPASAARLRPSDSQRLARAWEVWLASGPPLSAWQSRKPMPPYDRQLFEIHHITVERAALYRRINARVLAMLKEGAVEEVRALLALGLPPGLPALRIIGVPELSAYLRGEISLPEATERMQQATRNYAKRQLTWFRHQLQ